MLTEIVHWALRKFFVGRMLYRLGDLDGLRKVIAYGRIVGYDKTKFEVSYLEHGNSIRDARRVKLNRLKYDGHLKSWTYYD